MMNSIIIAPSSLDYKITKCPRCFYLDKKLKIAVYSYPPPVFSNFDVVQQNYFKNLNTKELSEKLPSGKIMTKSELPGRVVSKEMQDSKGRKFILGGRPDIVIKFDDESYGIIDFKTTQLSDDKADNYKYQLESYAQIFLNPGATKTAPTPKLDPISQIGVLQFFPSEIYDHEKDNCKLNFKMSYVKLNRDENDFYKRVELYIDIVSKENPPDYSDNCKDCNFAKTQKSMK